MTGRNGNEYGKPPSNNNWTDFVISAKLRKLKAAKKNGKYKVNRKEMRGRRIFLVQLERLEGFDGGGGREAGVGQKPMLD
uniref:Uncharacterized protein n=1 Tax=Cucumis sativus TaxID=3659 RepID=A0A0A0KPG2_CUCSA